MTLFEYDNVESGVTSNVVGIDANDGLSPPEFSYDDDNRLTLAKNIGGANCSMQYSPNGQLYAHSFQTVCSFP